jgi:hypothetical protein
LTNPKYLSTFASTTAGSQAFGLQPISTSLVASGKSSGGNPLGLEPVNQTWLSLDAGWWFSHDDEAMHGITKDMINEIETKSKAENQYLDYLFMNDAGWDQNVIQQYGQANVERLKQIQKRYDPNLVFQELVPGGYKL